VQSKQQTDTDLHRVILFASDGRALLVSQEGGRFTLPTVPLPRRQRVAEHLTAFIHREWSQDVVSLFGFDAPSTTNFARYQVMESTVAQRPTISGFRWVSISSLEETAFEESDDHRAIEIAYAKCEEHAGDHGHAPFGQLGWFPRLAEWVRDQIRHEGLFLNGRFAQLNASPTFGLVRFETNGSAVWFKAVGEPNLREYPITMALAQYFPAFVPRVIATRQDWNAWLAVEIPGTHPGESSDGDTWPTIAATLAELQFSSHGYALHLISDGCFDVRVTTLLDLVTPFFESMAGLMEKQQKPSPAPLCLQELISIGNMLREALQTLEESDIPNALGHLDFNPGNVLVSASRCIFLDWAEACVGHPFFTFEYVLEHAQRIHGTDRSQDQSIASSYAKRWESLVGKRKIVAALQASPLCAAFAYAAHHPAWRTSQAIRGPEGAAYLRGLTRRMKREADILRARGAVAVS